MTRSSTLAAILAGLGVSGASAQAPPPVLLITVERIKPGAEAEYAQIEKRIAGLCIRLDCPNNYLALESVAGPKEVWWFVELATEADVERLAHEYAQNTDLQKAMSELTALKKPLTAEPIVYLTKRGNDSGGSATWRAGRERFVGIAVPENRVAGAVFEAPNGTRFAIASAANSADALAAARGLGDSARVFEVRPAWSKPDPAWVKASPELWSPGKVAR